MTYIYFIETLGLGTALLYRPTSYPRSHERVKIGFTSNRPAARLATLQIGSPCQLGMFGSIKGGLAEEKALHQYFENYNFRGEWFFFADAVANVLMSLLWGITTVEDLKDIPPLASLNESWIPFQKTIKPAEFSA